MSEKLTVSVGIKVQQLIFPLCNDAEGVLQKCYNDQKSSNCRQVPMK